ncbi:transmembrane protein 179-like [Dreissena polymorpha]|uniref:Transmembrane protein 179 n=1 Tax=Dreissena polymorpha TaxID=45954 RepID=A0A9D4LAF1_DREPO|nr:transmembrane protein 179-like [Dreissena polymorpha]KAH3853406.1 hypothetical protein DPMN_095929 [Dreissena polymorpha]
MGISNLTVLCQITAFVLSFILSFFIFVPLAVNQYQFNGHCLLYATGTWNATSEQLTNVQWGPNSACGFGMFIGVVMMLLTIFYMCIDALHLLRDTDSSWLDSCLTTLVSFVIMLMLFAESITISVGFKHWCNVITTQPAGLVSCELAPFIPFDSSDNIDASSFYIHMKMAEFGSWSSFICWAFLFATSVIRVIRYQQHESFMTSVNRERERILQKYGPRNRGEYSAVPT